MSYYSSTLQPNARHLRALSLTLSQTIALFCSITDSAAVFINWLNDVVAQRAYSRKLEMEADQVGLNVSAITVIARGSA